jgi:hypothetical protein
MLSQLQLDLRELSQEARKKENELKDCAENALVILRNISEKYKDMNEQLQALQAAEDVLKPFLLGLGYCTSAPKIGLLAISGINKLVSYHALHESKLPLVVSSVAQAVDGGTVTDMTILLKVMQTVVAILTPPSPPLHGDDLARALGICFKLHSSKVTGLHQPAEASLRQIFSTILDRTWELHSATKAAMALANADTTEISNSTSSAPSNATIARSSSSSNLGSVPGSSTGQTSSLPSEKTKPSECDKTILDATRLLRDIVYLASGAQPVWLGLTSLDANFCLELVEEFLTSHKPLALTCPEFTAIVKDRISALLLQLLEHRRDIGFMIRLLRNCIAYISSFHTLQPMHCVTILGAFRSLLVPTQPFWLQVLILETFRWLCKDASSLLSRIVLEDDGLLRDKPQLLEAFIKFVGKIGRYVTTIVAKFEPNEFISKTTKPRFIDQLTYLDISSQMTSSHAITLSLACFVSFTDTMALLISPFDKSASDHLSSSLSSSSSSLPAGSPQSRDPSSPTAASPAQLDAIYRANQRMCDATWPSVLASLSVILAKTKDESLIQSSLKAYQSFTNTLGVLKLGGPRGAFLESLIKFALPFNLAAQTSASQHPNPLASEELNAGSTPSSPSQASAPLTHSFTLLSEEEYRNCKFTKKNIAAMKTILNIAHCMGSILDSSWMAMVETLNHLNGILACTRRIRNAGVVASSSSSSPSFMPNDDSNSISENASSTSMRARTGPVAVSQYELNTKEGTVAGYDWPTREEIDILDSALDSLFSTSVYISDEGLIDFANALISLSLVQFGRIAENTIAKPFNLFAFTSIMKLVRQNLTRVALIWTSVHKHVLQACNAANQGARQFALRGICGTIEEGVAAITKPPFEALPKEDPGYVSMVLMQVRFLETIEALINSRHEHIRIEILESMHRILQNSGSALSSGWQVILAILLNIGVSNEISLIPLGFKSVQSITNEYLHALPFECLAVTISTIGNFGGKSIADININIAAIGLLWNVADFIARKQSEILSQFSQPASHGSDSTQNSVECTFRSEDASPDLNDSGFRYDSSDPNFSVGSGGLFKGQATYVDSLWLALFQELSARVDNIRSEIRDCALATLYGILTTYGSTLNLPAWQNLLEKLLLPSLPWVVKQLELATREPDSPEGLSSMTSVSNLQTSSGGAQVSSIAQSTATSGLNANIFSNHSSPPTTAVQNVVLNNSHSSPHLSSSATSPANIVMHHSRNTQLKQWQETQISLMANMSRVFKAFIKAPLVNLPLPTFEKLYTTFLDHAEIFAKSSSLEVSQQAVNAVRDLLIATFGFLPDRTMPSNPSSISPSTVVPKSEAVATGISENAPEGDSRSSSVPLVSFPFSTQQLPPHCAELEQYAWRTWQRIANAIGRQRQQARLVGYFVEAIEEIFNQLARKHSDTLHIERLISVLEPLLFVPLELAGEYTILNKQVFPLLSSFALPTGLHARHSLPMLPQITSLCLTYISNAIGFRYTPACYTPTAIEIRHQLDSPPLSNYPASPHKSTAKSSSSSFVTDRGLWNVNQASLEKNFFNLADKSIALLQSAWEALIGSEYAKKCEGMILVSSFSQHNITSPSDASNPLSQEDMLQMSEKIALQLFPDIVSVLGYAIQVKQLDSRANFWAPSLDLFTRSSRETLPKLYQSRSSAPLLHQEGSLSATDVDTEQSRPSLCSTLLTSCDYTDIDVNIIWTGIIDSIESFLMSGGQDSRTSGYGALASSMSHGGVEYSMASSGGMGSFGGSEPIVAQAGEARLVELISNHMLYICPNLPNLHDRLFQILIDGCEMVNRENLMKQCYAGLFDAVYLGASSTFTPPDSLNSAKSPENRVRVAKLALPQLLKRCKIVLSKFISDDKKSGALPLPAARVVEVSFLLDQLKLLRIDPALWATPPKLESIASSNRRHLWELFPLLCECITAKEAQIKAIIKNIFLECGQELGLE